MAASGKAGKAKGKAKAADAPPALVPELLGGDMPKELREFTFACTLKALEEKDAEKDQAAEVKKALEAKADGLWHCIVGAEFGASLAADTGHWLFFQVGPLRVLVFRTLDEEAHALAAADDDTGDADDDEKEEEDDGEDIDDSKASN